MYLNDLYPIPALFVYWHFTCCEHVKWLICVCENCLSSAEMSRQKRPGAIKTIIFILMFDKLRMPLIWYIHVFNILIT